MADNNNTLVELLAEMSGDVDTRPGFREQLRNIIENNRFQALDPLNKVTWYDDFLGDLLDDSYSGAGGSDAQALTPAIFIIEGGAVRLVSGNVGGNDDAVDTSVLTHSLSWPADAGGLMIEARVKVDVITECMVFVGFTDVLGSTTVEFPLEYITATITDNAADAVGWIFDTDSTNDFLTGGGTKAGTVTAGLEHTAGMVAATYVVLRVEVRADGSAAFYVDGTLVGTLAACVTITVDMTPVIAVMSRDTTSKILDVDYVLVQKDR